MSSEKGGISIGEVNQSGTNQTVTGDVQVDQSQTTNVEGDATVNNTQLNAAVDDIEALMEGLQGLQMPVEEATTLKDRIIELKDAGEEAAGLLEPVKAAVQQYGPTVAQLAAPLLPGWANAALNAIL